MERQTLTGQARRAPAPEMTDADAWLESEAAQGDDEYNVERHGRLISVSRQIASLPAVRFLHAARGQERFFWRDGGQDLTFAGIGVAAHMIGYGAGRIPAIQRQADLLFSHAESDSLSAADGGSALAQPRLFGGFAFREDFVPDVTWTGFHPAHFILPHYQLVTRGEQCWLTINALVPAEEKVTANLPLLNEALEIRVESLNRLNENLEAAYPDPASPCASAQGHETIIDYPLSFAAWAQMIESARLTFAATPMRKVVLSRIAQLRAQRPFDIRQALARLCALYPDCYTFLFEPQPGNGFLGSTPELLVRVRGKEIETMALAGSIQRGANATEDAVLASALLSSAKDRNEHSLVVDALRNCLRPLTDTLSVAEEPAVLALRNIQHLLTPVRARLRRPEGVLPLVRALHPTPAMGGTPRELALEFIRAHEPNLRGWYAAPVGWIDRKMDGAFAVAIRSAVVQKERAWAYAGAGITPDSLPESEWNETDWKFQPIVTSLAGKRGR